MEALQGGLRSLVRTLIFICVVIAFLSAGVVIHIFTRDHVSRRRRFSRHATWWGRVACWVFNIHVVARNAPAENQAGLVVGNHLGFIDIIACLSIRPNLFVTSREMRETPVLGLITDIAGCLYVERRSRTNILNELGEMVDYLKNGFRVVLYPEATSTNGEGILPFKRTLLTAAAQAGVPIIPYVFNFREINGEKGFPLKYRDSVCWYGDISFPVAMWRAFSLKSIRCEIEFLSPVFTKTEDDRAVVADAIRGMILERFQPVERTLLSSEA